MLFFSCQYIGKQVPSENELFEKEIKKINWNEVDEFPSFINCEEIENKSSRQDCFFESLSTLIEQKLNSDNLFLNYPKLDTIQIKVSVSSNSEMKFESQFEKNYTEYDTLKIDSILNTRLIDFPKVSPAIKRGIPVKTEFILPVVLKTDK